MGKYPLITAFSVAAIVIKGSIYCYKKWQSRNNTENNKHVKKEHATTDKKIKTDTTKQAKTA